MTDSDLLVLDELAKLENCYDDGALSYVRSWQRIELRGEAELYPMNRKSLDRSPIEIALRNISRGGVGFLSSRALEVGSLWRMGLCVNGEIVGQQAIAIVHCTAARDDVYLLGGMIVIDNGLLQAYGISPDDLEH